MMYILLSIILLLLIIIGYTHFNYNKKQKQLNRQNIEKLRKEYSNKEKELLDNYLKENLKYEELRKDAYNKNQQILKEQSKSIEDQLVLLKKNKYTQLLNYEEKEKQKINQELSAYFREAALQKKNIENELKDVLKELEDYKKKKLVTINQWKKEEEKELNQLFYKISLSNNDKEDMLSLARVGAQIHNLDIIPKLIYETYLKNPVQSMLNRVVGAQTYSGIYKITHIQSQRAYIGRSVDIKKRLTDHIKSSIGISSIADQEIHHAISEYGIDQFTFEVLEKVDKDKLSEREKYWINFYQTQDWGWNGNSGG